jgi:Protein of unknown function (DUF1592)/Protein of unknown function (DUF1588)/Protein of unknown function (DUF1587)/Protein of unknown function (DUF1595)/Protein of unknown function (DUF1585)
LVYSRGMVGPARAIWVIVLVGGAAALGCGSNTGRSNAPADELPGDEAVGAASDDSGGSEHSSAEGGHAAGGQVGDQLNAPAGDGGASGSDAGALPLPRVAPELLHRLNRLEYDRTLRDLIGTSLEPAAAFPADSSLDAFDNFAEGLSLSPALLDLYLDAARAVADAALQLKPRYSERFDALPLGLAPGYPFGSSAFSLASSTLTASLSLVQAETVTLSVTAGGTFLQAPTPIMSIRVDSLSPQTFTVDATPSAPKTFSITVELSAGKHTVRVKCDNYVNKPSSDITNQLTVGSITAEGAAQLVPASRSKVYICEPAQEPDRVGCYQRIVRHFAERAFRRPLVSAEVESLSALWQALRPQEGDDEALALVVRAVLVSPNFLYRPSFTVTDSTPDARGLLPLDDYTLASRLSYFLWSSMPDDALFAAASRGELQTDAGLSREVDRMLADPKASALEQGFAEQWLDARALEFSQKDAATYPDFDQALRAAMISEVGQFFGAFRNSSLPVQQMLDPGFGFVNDRLARHYGLPLPNSTALTRVTLPAGARGGILFQGAWLTATSEANRTSPVKRGRFLLDRILCRTIPPPPPNVPAFVEPAGTVTVRERLAQHRASPVCAGCHNLLDPVGLGLEELDGIGQLRSVEAGAPVDSSGALPPNEESFVADLPYDGGSELVALLAGDPRFSRCLTQKLYGYALGRKLSPDDEPDWRALSASQNAKSSIPDLVRAITLSASFRGRDSQETAQ